MSVASPWAPEGWIRPELAAQAREVAGSVGGSLGLARDLEEFALTPGTPSWPALATLATLGSVDLTTARTIEPHLDAIGILRQAEVPFTAAGSTWGVYAANPPGTRLTALRGAGGTWLLNGTKPWCSLADRVSHALVTATDAQDGDNRLLAVALRQPGVAVGTAPWVARGLREVTTGTVTFADVPADAVGGPGWYLERPGFAHGGIGVAAVWFGGAAALAGSLWESARRRPPDQIAHLHLGACDVALHTALLALRDAAGAIDDGRAEGDSGRVLAARVRAVVAGAAQEVLTRVGHALGPGPLAHDAVHAARVADLTLYLRQHHAERDLAALGRSVTDSGTSDAIRAGPA